MKISQRVAALGVSAVVAGTLLSGCSALSGLNRVASCSRVATAGSDLKDALTSVTAQADDPSAAVETVSKATDRFADQTKDIRDASVKAKTDAVVSALRTLSSDLKAAESAPSATAASKIDTDKSAVLDAAHSVIAACE